jgi:hypothetical protein
MTLPNISLAQYMGANIFLIVLIFLAAVMLNAYLPLIPDTCEGDRFDSRIIVLSN